MRSRRWKSVRHMVAWSPPRSRSRRLHRPSSITMGSISGAGAPPRNCMPSQWWDRTWSRHRCRPMRRWTVPPSSKSLRHRCPAGLPPTWAEYVMAHAIPRVEESVAARPDRWTSGAGTLTRARTTTAARFLVRRELWRMTARRRSARLCPGTDLAHAARWDREEHHFPAVDAAPGLAALGCYGVAVPEQWGGAGLITWRWRGPGRSPPATAAPATVISVTNCPVFHPDGSAANARTAMVHALARGEMLGAFA